MLEKIKVLVINNSYEPLNFCTAKRAIVMVITGRANQVECDGIAIHSFSREFPCPTVIRLNRFVRLPYTRGIPFNKKNVIRRDRYTCQYCGATNTDLTIDHIVPRSHGGESNWHNVVAACKKCNIAKGNRRPEEAGLTLRARPTKPRFITLLAVPQSAPSDFLSIWEKYFYYSKTSN